ncbi:aminoglycoside phosphotransferase family protein [Nocardioides sp. MAHUQ-72]|uniref:aminoglycoside phosphotransferase family protein n=1 Tax=unclassified Nocardioides TaxID=2615069 RepID=UPI00361E7BC5
MAMHENEVVATVEQVETLVSSQFPHWKDLPVRPLPIGGTDHALFRLGDELVARMPRVDWAVDQAENDGRWLPYLAPHLPLPVPVPVALGEPGAGFPHPWSVVPWLPGETPTPENLELEQAAVDLAGFVRALRAVPPGGGPPKTGTSRGTPLAGLDGYVRESVVALGDRVDAAGVTRVWEDALDAAAYDGPPTWMHGDLLAGNLLCGNRRLSGVIDFGGLGLGDPAPDVTPAWILFEGRSREAYRRELGCGDDEWRRGRGWALAPALGGLVLLPGHLPALLRPGPAHHRRGAAGVPGLRALIRPRRRAAARAGCRRARSAGRARAACGGRPSAA